jgi:regulator of nucleoside diphosphate kinase
MTSLHSGRGAALPAITIPASHYDRLAALATQAPPAVESYLERELARAAVVPDAEFNPHIARIGSKVVYRDETSGQTLSVTLAWPGDADIRQRSISVLTSIGAALLGMRPGMTIDWLAPLDGAQHELTVLSVDNTEAPRPTPFAAMPPEQPRR